MQAYQRQVETQLDKLATGFTDIRRAVAEAVKPNGWSAIVSDVEFRDRGMAIPEWQDIGCSVSFEASGNISVVSIGCSMSRAYGYSTLHYEITDGNGAVIVPRDPKRLASTNYSAVSASQTAVGRLFAHTLRPGVYIARLLVHTDHANTTDWDATLSVFSASIAVRDY